MSADCISLHFQVEGGNFASAGIASENVKMRLKQLGIAPAVIRRVAIAMYEAEINMVIHASGGTADIDIYDTHVDLRLSDTGPGIPDVGLAMQEGFSTAPDNIRSLGFGAGMGLPNMRKYSDKLDVISEVGKGTTVSMRIYITEEQAK